MTSESRPIPKRCYALLRLPSSWPTGYRPPARHFTVSRISSARICAEKHADLIACNSSSASWTACSAVRKSCGRNEKSASATSGEERFSDPAGSRNRLAAGDMSISACGVSSPRTRCERRRGVLGERMCWYSERIREV